MLKNTLIIALVIVIIYLYYQQNKPEFLTGTNEIVSKKKEKLGGKTLDEILEENEDYETEVDTLTRTKNSLEQDLTAQAEAFQARLREKDREVRKVKDDLKTLESVREKLTSEKQQHKGSLERIKLLTQQISNLEQEKSKLEEKLEKMPGEFPDETSSIASQELTDQSELEAFIQWVADYEEFKKVDWDYYRSQANWEKAFRNWNKLRTDRISLLEKWIASKE